MTSRLGLHYMGGRQLPPWRGDPRLRCSPATAHLFHASPEERPPAKQAREAQAKALCAACPRRGDCLNWAIATDASGICGGLTQEEREIEKRRRAVMAA